MEAYEEKNERQSEEPHNQNVENEIKGNNYFSFALISFVKLQRKSKKRLIYKTILKIPIRVNTPTKAKYRVTFKYFNRISVFDFFLESKTKTLVEDAENYLKDNTENVPTDHKVSDICKKSLKQLN